jgi:hypothetical protein
LKYGTVPIVRATGGLDDSIEPFDLEHGTGTGFKFKEYTGEALLFAVRQALHHYMDERVWKRIQLNGMAQDFSWKTPAVEYAKLYEAARASRGFAPLAQIAGRAVPSLGQPASDAGETSQGSGQTVRSVKPRRQAAGQGTQGSGQQATQDSEQAPQGSGQAERNQKPAGTSN